MQFVTAVGKVIGNVWKDLTGFLRHDSGRLTARKVAGVGLLVLFTILTVNVLRENVAMAVRIGNIMAMWPILAAGAGLVGLTVGPLA